MYIHLKFPCILIVIITTLFSTFRMNLHNIQTYKDDPLMRRGGDAQKIWLSWQTGFIGNMRG